MLVWQLCPKCFEGHFWTATKKSELYFMPVFKQKCVFVIHDVEDKLILWKKKNTVWFQKGHWNPGCFQKRLCVWESEAEARLQLGVNLLSSLAAAHAEVSSSHVTLMHCGSFLWVLQSQSLFPIILPLLLSNQGVTLNSHVSNINETKALNFFSHLWRLSKIEMIRCFLYSA